MIPPESDRQPAANRSAVDQLPVEVERVVQWLRSMHRMLAEPEWTDEERREWMPGCRFLLDLGEEELTDARNDLAALQRLLTRPAETVFREDRATGHPRYGSRQYVEQLQGHYGAAVRSMLRGYLQEVVEIARSFAVSVEELPVLLADVTPIECPSDSDEPAPEDANVIPLARKR